MGRWATIWTVVGILVSARAVGAAELPQPRDNWEVTAGFTPLSYGFHEGLGGDGHFDTFTTLASAGLDLSGGYRFRHYLLFGLHLEYLFSLGRADYWSTDYEPGVHRVRVGPKAHFRMPGDSVEPFLELSGGFSALFSTNNGDNYRAPGVFAGFGLGANLPLAATWGAFVRYRALIDYAEMSHMDGADATYFKNAAVVAFLQEATVGLFVRF